MVAIHDDMELEGLVLFFAFDHYTIRVVLCFSRLLEGTALSEGRNTRPPPLTYIVAGHASPPTTTPHPPTIHSRFRFSHFIPLSGTHGLYQPFRKLPKIFLSYPNSLCCRANYKEHLEWRPGSEGARGQTNQREPRKVFEPGRSIHNNTITKTHTCLVTAAPKKSSTMRHHSISSQPSLWARRSRKMKEGARCFKNPEFVGRPGQGLGRSAWAQETRGDCMCPLWTCGSLGV